MSEQSFTNPDVVACDGVGDSALRPVKLSAKWTVGMSFVNIPTLMALGVLGNPLAPQDDPDADEDPLPDRPLNLEERRAREARQEERRRARQAKLTPAERLAQRQEQMRFQDSVFAACIVEPRYVDMDTMKERKYRREPGTMWIGLLSLEEITEGINAVFGEMDDYLTFRDDAASAPDAANDAGIRTAGVEPVPGGPGPDAGAPTGRDVGAAAPRALSLVPGPSAPDSPAPGRGGTAGDDPNRLQLD